MIYTLPSTFHLIDTVDWRKREISTLHISALIIETDPVYRCNFFLTPFLVSAHRKRIGHWLFWTLMICFYFPDRYGFISVRSMQMPCCFTSFFKKTFFILLVFIFWPHHIVCGILVPWPRIKPMPPALETWSLNHWIAREVLFYFLDSHAFYSYV